MSDIFPLESHIPPQSEPMEYVDHPIAFVPTPSTAVIYPSEPATTPPASPTDLTLLAMLGLTIAGAGVMKSQSAIAKQNEQEAKKSKEFADLQAQLDTQKTNASANWEANLAMQAEAGQDVVVGVKQSQANKNYWAAFAIWQAQVAAARARRRAAELARKKATNPKPSTSRPLPNLIKTAIFVMLLGGVGLAGGSVRVGQLPSQQIMSVVDNLPEQSCMADTFVMTPVLCPFGSNGGWSPVLIATAQWVRSTALGRVEELKPLFYTLPLAMLEFGVSITFQPVDTALSIIRIANDISNGTVGWHNVFDVIPIASSFFVGLRWLDDDILGGGARQLDNLDDVPANQVDETIQRGDDLVILIDAPQMRVINTYNEWRNMPKPDGWQGHHGMLSQWYKANYSNYDSRLAPVIIMPNNPNHNATRSVYNTWSSTIKNQRGWSEVNWRNVTYEEIMDLNNRMRLAAEIPDNVWNEYLRVFNEYARTLIP